jgi:hypothetical protein
MDVYNIRGWHTTTDAARYALARIRPTHTALPLPLFSRSERGPRRRGPGSVDDWVLAEPQHYEESLRDALVAVTFNLTLYEIDGRDVWTANIIHIRKLKPLVDRIVVRSPARAKRRPVDIQYITGVTARRRLEV